MDGKFHETPYSLANRRTRRVLVLFRRLVMQVTRVTASIDFPSPTSSPPSDRFRWIRADNWVSAIERTNRQGIEPRKRTSGKPGIHFPLFHRALLLSPFPALVQPSIYVLYRHRGNMIAMSKTRKRMGGRGHHPCRNERSLNRGPDNSVLIFRSLDFFFLPPFLSMVFYNVSNDRAREQFSRTRLNVNEKLLKKKEYICRKLGYY